MRVDLTKSQINIFKDTKLFDDLSQYNPIINDLCKTYTYNIKDELGNYLSPFFNPLLKNEYWLISRYYPNINLIQFKPCYNLTLTHANYLFLFLMNTLYGGRKDLLVEDFAGGMGWLLFYLGKCGFTNLQLTEDFSQISQCYVENFRESTQSQFNINTSETPIALNLCGYPHEIPDYVNDDKIELFVLYESLDTFRFFTTTILPQSNFTMLCHDQDTLSWAFCRKDKYEEFNELLLPYREVI